MVAFAAFGQASISEDIYKASLTSYQRCITALKQMRMRDTEDWGESYFFLTAICFLGLLEVSSGLVLDREETLTE
jgi:hypothetical protein